jgi:Zn-dependent protease
MSAELSFAKYTANAQSTLINATREAENMQHAQVQPEHLLLSLLSPESGTAWSLLASTLRNPAIMQEGLRIVLADATPSSAATPPEYSFRIKRTLSEAEDEARRAGQEQVDTGHMLLGLLDEGGAAGQMLRRNGLDAARLRHWLRQPQSAAAPLVAGPTVPRPTAAKPIPAVPTTRDERLARLESQPLKKLLPRLISWPAIGVMLGLLIASAIVMGAADGNLARAALVMFVIDGWIISLCAHEFAHAFTADLGGDRSVRGNGYLSFNPLKYTHPVLSILLPLLFMMMGGLGLPGGAVYVQTQRLRAPKWESAVSFAGPAASALMAMLFALPFTLRLLNVGGPVLNPMLWEALAVVVLLNCAAVVFNLIPIPPLDGFGIIAPVLSPSLRAVMASFSMFGLILVIVAFNTSPAFSEFFYNTVNSMLQTLNVDPLWASLGLSEFMFWR